MLPRLDVNGIYRFVGLGQDLYNGNPANINGPNYLVGTSALQVLGSGQYQEWQAGVNFAMPLGFRKELAQIRHYELQLAREKGRLQDEELEVSHEVGDALRNLEYNYAVAQTNFNRRVATEKQVEAVQAAFDAETVTLDLLLNAQQQRADAEVSYYRTLVDYVRGIVQVHYRKGSLLEYNGVYLAEGPWPAKAQFDAYRLARQRDASFFLDYGFTRPRVISQGPYKQFADGKEPGQQAEAPLTNPAEETPTGATPETIPSPPPSTPKAPAGETGGDRAADNWPASRQPTLARVTPDDADFAEGNTSDNGGRQLGGNAIDAPANKNVATSRLATRGTGSAWDTIKPADRTTAGSGKSAAASGAKNAIAARTSGSAGATASNPKARSSTVAGMIDDASADTKRPAVRRTARPTQSASDDDGGSQAARDSAVEPASYQWKSTATNDSAENQSSDSTDRPAAIWQRAKGQ